MMRRASWMLALIALVALLAPACGDDGDGGNCPSVAGTWTLQEHCEPTMVGNPVTVTQDGCSITADWGGGTLFHGTMSEDGGSTLTGDAGGTQLTCTGAFSGTTWTEDCNPGGCHVVAVRQ